MWSAHNRKRLMRDTPADVLVGLCLGIVFLAASAVSFAGMFGAFD